MTKALSIIPQDRKFAVAMVPGLGGVVVAMFAGSPALWHVSKALGNPKNRAAYDAACARAAGKLAA